MKRYATIQIWAGMDLLLQVFPEDITREDAIRIGTEHMKSDTIRRAVKKRDLPERLVCCHILYFDGEHHCGEEITMRK